MDSGEILGRYADDNVVENHLSAVVADRDLDDLLVLYAVFGSRLGGHMHMTLRDDHAVIDLDLAFGSAQDASGSALKITGLADHAYYAELSGLGHRDLYLIFGAERSEDGHGDLTLGAYDGHLLGAGELTGLGKVLLVGQAFALSVQSRKGLCGNVQMMSGCFYHNFLHNHTT